MEKSRIAAALFLLLAGGIVRPTRAESARQRTVTPSAARAGVAQRRPLSAAERRRLQRDQARRRHDLAAAELERFRNALIAAGEMRGEWSAGAPSVRKAVPPQARAAADETVQDLSVDADIGRVFTVDLGATPETPDGPEAPEAEAGSEAGPVPVVEEVVVETSSGQAAEGVAAPDGERDERDTRDGRDMEEDVDVEATEAGPGAAAPDVPTAPASPTTAAKPARPPAEAAPLPPPIG